MTIDLGPLTEQLTKAITQVVAEKALITEPLTQALSKLDVWKAYTAEEAGEFLGLSKSSIYAIPEARLKRTYTGASGSSVRFLGVHILCHLLGLPQVDAKKVGQEMIQSFLAQSRPPLVRASEKRADGSVRVI